MVDFCISGYILVHNNLPVPVETLENNVVLNNAFSKCSGFMFSCMQLASYIVITAEKQF